MAVVNRISEEQKQVARDLRACGLDDDAIGFITERPGAPRHARDVVRPTIDRDLRNAIVRAILNVNRWQMQRVAEGMQPEGKRLLGDGEWPHGLVVR